MKKFLMATTALAMFGVGAASAADLPTRKGPPIAPVYVPPAFTWTGFYVGLNAGAGWATNSRNNNGLPIGAIPVTGFVASSGSSNNAGFVGGAQAGYNYQFTPGQGFVIGAETDIDYVGINNNKRGSAAWTFATTPGTTFFANGSGHNSSNYLGTVRARVGYAFDHFLIYGTGGLAYGDVGQNARAGGFAITAPGAIVPFTGLVAGPGGVTTPFGGTSNNSTRAGWTVGGGVEYAVWQNWTVKAEYLYYNLGSQKNNFVSPFFAGSTSKSHNSDGSIVRVGLNYKFW